MRTLGSDIFFRQIAPSRAEALDDQQWSELLEIYHQAIPAGERKTDSAIRQMGNREDYRFFVALDSGRLIGFAICHVAIGRRLALLEYMGVAASRRNAGIGGRLVDFAHAELREYALLLEVDAPVASAADRVLAARRIGFYQRHGAYIVPMLDYLMPKPAGAECVPPAMYLMVIPADGAGRSVTRNDVLGWLTYLYVDIYGQAGEDPRLPEMMDPLPERFDLARHGQSAQ